MAEVDYRSEQQIEDEVALPVRARAINSDSSEDSEMDEALDAAVRTIYVNNSIRKEV